MAGKKSRTSRTSNGGRKNANVAREQKRQAKFAAKREAGNAYQYKPNPYKAESAEYYEEAFARMQKNRSHKLPIALWDSWAAKLKNELNKEAQIQKAMEEKIKPKKNKAKQPA